MRSLRKKIVVLLCAALCVGLCVWGLSIMRILSHRAIVADHAVWLARYWEPESDIRNLVERIEREHQVEVALDQWREGTKGTALIGPIVGGREIVIMTDRRVLWRSIKDRNEE